MKNSSMFEPTNDRNISRSSSGIAAVLRLFQHAPLKVQQAQLAVDVTARDRREKCGDAVRPAWQVSRHAAETGAFWQVLLLQKLP